MFADEEVMRFIGPRRALTETETQEWLRSILQRQDIELMRYAVALKDNDELIGVAGLKDEEGVNDFGYYFRRQFWGKGFASEACSAILEYIETELRITAYQIFIADENVPSQALIAKLGLQPTQHIVKSGELGYLYRRI